MAISIRTLYRLNNTVGFTLALPLNAILLICIFWHTPKEMRAYSVVLAQVCIMDMVVASAWFSFMPCMVTIDGALLKFPLGYFHFEDIPMPTLFWFSSFNSGAVIIGFSSIGVQFLYRYLMMVRQARLGARHYFAMLTVPVALTVIAVWLTYVAYYPTPETMAAMAVKVADLLEEPGSTEVIVPFISKPIIAYQVRNDFFTLVLVSTYTLIVFCAYKCWAYLRDARSLQRDTGVDEAKAKERHRLDRQIGWALIVQAFFPLVTMAIPTYLFIASGLWGWSPQVSRVCSMAYFRALFYPVVGT